MNNALGEAVQSYFYSVWVLREHFEEAKEPIKRITKKLHATQTVNNKYKDNFVDRKRNGPRKVRRSLKGPHLHKAMQFSLQTILGSHEISKHKSCTIF